MTLDMHPNMSADFMDAVIVHAQSHGPHYLVPILKAVRDHGCANAILPQGKDVFRFPNDKPIIAIVRDDDRDAIGPKGLHAPSLRRLIKKCSAAFVVSSSARLKPYAAAATHAAFLRQHVVLIRTQPQFEQEWIAFIRSIRPDIAMLLNAVEPAKGVH